MKKEGKLTGTKPEAEARVLPAYFFLNTRSRTGSLSMMNPVTRF